MTSRSLRVLVSIGLVAILVGMAAPAGAAGRAGTTTVIPTCTIAGPHQLFNAQFLNGKTVNGTWAYGLGVSCTGNLDDMVLYAEIDFNGAKVDSHTKGFTGVPRSVDAEGYFPFACAMCSGTWGFTFGEILQAPAGLHWVASPGCVAVSNGLYLYCVQQQTEVIP